MKLRLNLKYFIVFVLAGMMFFSCSGKRPGNLGVFNGRLADCPSKPNCVCSQTNNKNNSMDENHAIAPLIYREEKKNAFTRLKTVIASFKRNTIITQTDNYLHVEFKSTVMGFIDDVEFYFPKEKIIHVRSASRLGYSDFGVNRKRIEQIREQFTLDSSNARQ